jgi:hypothetical protein
MARGKSIFEEVPLMVRPLIDGLFPTLAEDSMIYGPPCSCKTSLAILEICSLLYAPLLPAPVSVLGSFTLTPPNEPLKIMLLQAERTHSDMRTQFQATIRGLFASEENYNPCHDPALLTLADKQFRLFTREDYVFGWFQKKTLKDSPLWRHLRQFRADVIYVDSLTSVQPEIEKPSVESRFIWNLRELERDLGYRPAWRFIHHTSKGGSGMDPAGGFPLLAYFRSHVQLKRAETYEGWSYLSGNAKPHDSNSRPISVQMKVETIEPGSIVPYRIQYRADTGRLNVSTGSGRVRQSRRKKHEAIFLKVRAENPTADLDEMYRKTGISKPTLSRYLRAEAKAEAAR